MALVLDDADRCRQRIVVLDEPATWAGKMKVPASAGLVELGPATRTYLPVSHRGDAMAREPRCQISQAESWAVLRRSVFRDLSQPCLASGPDDPRRRGPLRVRPVELLDVDEAYRLGNRAPAPVVLDPGRLDQHLKCSGVRAKSCGYLGEHWPAPQDQVDGARSGAV